MIAFFGFLKRCIRSAPRDVVPVHLRSLFKTFMGAFQVLASVPLLLESVSVGYHDIVCRHAERFRCRSRKT